MFDRLEREIVYDDPNSFKVKCFGSQFTPRRKQAAFADEGVEYTYSKGKLTPRPWTPLLLSIRDRVEKTVGVRYNFVLVNRYNNGIDRIGSHRDDEPEID